MKRSLMYGMTAAVLLIMATHSTPSGSPAATTLQRNDGASANEVPVLEFDPTWPKRPLPNQWIMGAVMAIHVDEKDHVWVMQWPHYLAQSDDYAAKGLAECCRPAPFVIEFDAAGGVAQGWGDQKDPALPEGGFQWARARGGAHGLYVDHKGNVWTGSHTPGGKYVNSFANLAKFTHDGKFIMQKGAFGQSRGNGDTDNFAQPTGIAVDPKANEAFISDGYDNRRVIVIDADTMAFKRMWGAYGNQPLDGPMPPRTPDGPPPQQFTGVHCVKLSHDDLVYVCDRPSDRIQVFKKDGTFVKEGFVAPQTRGIGTVADIAFSTDSQQQFLYVADGSNRKVWIVRRADLQVIGSFGNGGHYGGEFAHLHAIASDSKGNVYVGEHEGGNRVQKFKMTGFRKSGSQ